MSYSILFEFEAKEQLKRFDRSIQLQILKKVVQMETKASARHLKFGTEFFVEEIGQYRIAFKVEEQLLEKKEPERALFLF